MPSSRSLASGLSQSESLAQMDQASSSRSRRSAPSSGFPSHSTRPWRELKSIHAVHPSLLQAVPLALAVPQVFVSAGKGPLDNARLLPSADVDR